eukprot:GHVQ01012001.1.p1 GENE.GHVQ01012001.1~~GHVQ01012001.1.p1  ORF type:complete len:571 (+),score=120.00 GHVQ01012001.1:728-2440(+)
MMSTKNVPSQSPFVPMFLCFFLPSLPKELLMVYVIMFIFFKLIRSSSSLLFSSPLLCLLLFLSYNHCLIRIEAAPSAPHPSPHLTPLPLPSLSSSSSSSSPSSSLSSYVSSCVSVTPHEIHKVMSNRPLLHSSLLLQNPSRTIHQRHQHHHHYNQFSRKHDNTKNNVFSKSYIPCGVTCQAFSVSRPVGSYTTASVEPPPHLLQLPLLQSSSSSQPPSLSSSSLWSGSSNVVPLSFILYSQSLSRLHPSHQHNFVYPSSSSSSCSASSSLCISPTDPFPPPPLARTAHHPPPMVSAADTRHCEFVISRRTHYMSALCQLSSTDKHYKHGEGIGISTPSSVRGRRSRAACCCGGCGGYRHYGDSSGSGGIIQHNMATIMGVSSSSSSCSSSSSPSSSLSSFCKSLVFVNKRDKVRMGAGRTYAAQRKRIVYNLFMSRNMDRMITRLRASSSSATASVLSSPAVQSVVHEAMRFWADNSQPILIGCVFMLRFFKLLLYARYLLEWLPQVNPYLQPFQTIYSATDTYMGLFQSLIPPVLGIDLSGLTAWLFLEVTEKALSGNSQCPAGGDGVS